jgi:uncharacterized membrane protein
MRRDQGSVMVYALGGVLLVLAVVLVLADTSSLFMRRAALLAIADNAAIAAANAVDVPSIYETGVTERLRLDPVEAQSLAQSVVGATQDARLADVLLDSVEVVADAVTVTLSAAVPAPLSGITGTRTLRIRAQASAAMPTRS